MKKPEKPGSGCLTNAGEESRGRWWHLLPAFVKQPDPGFYVAGAGFVLTLAAFWPGYLSWDSAYQWWQARGAALDPAHPPVMVHVWRAARSVLPDPGGMLALQAAVWWSALALFATALGGGAWRRGATVAMLGLWPPLLALLPHLWKDVWMAGLFALAVACLAFDARTPRRAWRAGAVAALALGCAFRLNALPAVLPLLAWVAWRESSTRPRGPRRTARVALATAALVAATLLASVLVNRVPGKAQPVWPVIAMWDLAAVSIAEDRLLFPPDWIEPGLTVADLRRDFVPYVNVPSFAHGQLKLNPWFDATPAQFAALRDAWLALPLHHPRAYAAHRLRLSAYLVGLRQAEHPDSLVIAPGVVAFDDNPPLAANAGALNRWLQPLLGRTVDTPVFAAWPYLAGALAIALAALGWRRGPVHRELAGAVAASALCLAAPLVVLSPSSDFRYLLWSVFAALLAAALWFAPPAPR